MNTAHLHLILTHVPVLGVVFATLLLAVGLYRRNRQLQQTAFVVFIVAGLAAGPAFWTGEGAEDAIAGTGEVGTSLVERHEEAALPGLIAVGISGAMALIALARTRHGRQVPRSLVAADLFIGLVATGILAWVANTGGQIRHAEIRNGHVAAEVEGPTP